MESVLVPSAFPGKPLQVLHKPWEMLSYCTVAAVFKSVLFALPFQTSIDILTTVVRNTKPPLSQLLICQAFPAVAQCSLNTDDNATMQVTSVGMELRECRVMLVQGGG